MIWASPCRQRTEQIELYLWQVYGTGLITPNCAVLEKEHVP
jgi:hypothetical protein